MEHLDQFNDQVKTPSWYHQSRSIGYDIQQALHNHEAFRNYTMRFEDNTVVVEVQWSNLRSGSQGLHRSFFAMYGEIAEEGSFVSRTEHHDSVVYEVITGSYQGTKPAGEAHHGHSARFRLVGANLGRLPGTREP